MFAIIEQNMHPPFRCVSWFCLTKASICSFVIELIWVWICSLLSSGKLSNCVRSCSLILLASSSVIGMLELCLRRL